MANDVLSGLQKLSNSLALKDYTLPTGKKLYYCPSNAAETEIINRLRGGDESNFSLWCATMTVKALTEKRVRVFSNDDYTVLKELRLSDEMKDFYDLVSASVPFDEKVAAFTTSQA